MIYHDLVLNVALLLALSLLYSFLVRFGRLASWLRRVYAGLLFGGVAVVGMLNPFHWSEGVIFDGRSIVLSMAGYFGGWVTGGLAALIAAIFRLSLGGSGALTGVGVALTSAALGLVYRSLCRKFPQLSSPVYIYAFGVVVHLVMLAWMLSLPGGVAFEVLRVISLPVMIIFPLGTLFLGLLLADQEQRQQTEFALRRSEARYRSLFDENHSVMLIIHPETAEIVDANQAACDYYGWSYEEITRKSITQINTLSPEEVHAEMQRAKHESRNYFFFEHRLASGEIRPVEVYSCPIEIDGQILLYSIIHDITERREAEKALRESQHRFKEMLENVELIAVMLDTQGSITFCNDHILKLTGWKRDEVLGESWFELFIPDDVKEDLHESVFLKTFRNGEVKPHHINEIITRSGERRLISWNNTVFRDLEGGVIGTTSLGEDITERVLVEEEIQRRNQELSTLVEISQRLLGYRERTELLAFIVEEIVKIIPGAEAASLWEFDETTTRMIPRAWYGHEDDENSGIAIDPNSSLVGLVYRTCQSQMIANTLQESAFENLGQSKLDTIQSVIGVPLMARDEVIGTLFADSYSHTEAFTEHDQRLLESIAYQASLALENARLFKQIGRHADELEQRIDERTDELRRRVEEGEVLNRGMVNLMEDIQTANQRANSAASRLAVANQELEAFAYSVSHDLSAPLRGIRGFAEILADRHRAGLDEQGQEYIDYVVQAGDQMAALIANLLEYSRLGRRAAQAVPIDLELIIDEVLGGLSETVRQNQAQIVLPESYPLVMGDRTPLIQIFSNLFDNALKYRRPDLPPKIELLWREDSDYAMIQVSDNGIGIPEEHREQIFILFQRLNSGDDIPGAGIGLALVRKALQLLDGEVEVDSAEGGGTTFIVKLPLAERSGE